LDWSGRAVRRKGVNQSLAIDAAATSGFRRGDYQIPRSLVVTEHKSVTIERAAAPAVWLLLRCEGRKQLDAGTADRLCFERG
jgi:hypothetical protein